MGWPMSAPEPPAAGPDGVLVSYCVVNTSQRELLLRGLDALAKERARVPFATEVLVLDNASRDGSAEAAAQHPACDETIVLARRRGKALNDSELLQRARGSFALPLNEDSELRPGATEALLDALRERPRPARARAKLLAPDAPPRPRASRSPSVATALAGALFLHPLATAQRRRAR